MPASRLTSKGQLTLPKKIRDQLRVRPGDRVEFRPTKAGKVVVEAASQDLRNLKGAFKAPAGGLTLEEMDSAIRKGSRGA